MDWAADRNLSVLLDVHTAKGSQNGFDNGGRVKEIIWYNQTMFEHDGAVSWLNNEIWTNGTDAEFN
jgi:glucan 1,3-beta-glucosidase